MYYFNCNRIRGSAYLQCIHDEKVFIETIRILDSDPKLDRGSFIDCNKAHSKAKANIRQKLMFIIK